MSDEEDELRRMLAARADRVRSTLSGPAIRARAQARRPLRRYAPVLTAAAVLAVVVVSLVLLQRGGPQPVQLPPAAPVTTSPEVTTTVSPPVPTSPSPSTTTKHSQVSSTPMSTTAVTTSSR